MFTKSIHSKILAIVIGVISVGVVVTIYLGYSKHESDLLQEKYEASKLMSAPILHSIYEDMLEERADLARHLLEGLKKIEGVERVQIIRSGGTEEAFMDLKTIKDVEKEFGEILPEWIEGHEEREVNIAEGVDTEGFKEALESFRGDWGQESLFYIEHGEKPLLTYLHPIEKRPKCNGCHDTEGARGILMISSSLDNMYIVLKRDRSRLILTGIFTILLSGFFLSVVIKKSITGPIERTVGVIKQIADGGTDISERVTVKSQDELGYLSTAFNSMLDSLQKRDDANRQLFTTVIKSREEWVSTFDAIQDLISIHDRDDKIVKVNMALAKSFGVKPENLIGKTCNDLLFGTDDSDTPCPHLETVRTGEVAQAEFSGDEITLEGNFKFTTFPIVNELGAVTATVHIISDISEETTLKEQLLHTEKVSSIGKFVAGIAHELNNPLMGIMGFSQILLDSAGDKRLDSPDVKDKLTKIYDESLRTAKIVQNLLTFARAKKIEKSSHNINELINKTLEAREHILKEKRVDVELLLDKELPRTMVDHFQMQQVFVNIINNAMDAMVESHGGGNIVIRTSSTDKDIEIVFRDDGPGIPAENLSKIFDPFFTTKEVGKGTGLGLSIIHGIIIEHGGTIAIESPEEQGTIVTIKIPTSAEAQMVKEKKEVVSTDGRRGIFAGKRVLIADDEQSIREALSQVLEAEGFSVLTVPDGRWALEALEREEFELVITDIKMPEVTGIELYETIKEEYGELIDHTVVLTGDVLSDDVKHFLKDSGCTYVLKPFNPRELLELLQKVLT